MPVTIQTPLHLQRLSLRHDCHLINLPVAGRAAHAFVYVNRMIEISKVGQIVDPHPFHWLAGLETRAHRFEIRAVGPDLLVTAHADGRGRHAGRRGFLDRCMTVTTIDPVVADVVLMTELNGLLALDVLPGVPA